MNKKYIHENLLVNYIKQHLNKTDTIVHIGDLELDSGCNEIFIPNFTTNENAELVCRYEDIAYFM